MRRFLCFTILGIIFQLIYLQYNLSTIKKVEAGYTAPIEYSEKINVSGEFENIDSTSISLSYPAFIKDIYVKENSYVNKGQALFSLDIKRMTDFVAGNYGEDFYKIIDESILSKINSCTYSLDNIKEVIYASESGIVSQINIYPGAIVFPTQQLVTISNSEDIMAKFTVSQLDYGKINVGDSVQITPIAFSGVNYNGYINNHNAVIKKENTAIGSKTVVDVFASITDSDKYVADGLQVNAVINKGDSKIIDIIDYKFINQDSVGEYVFIADKGKAVKKYIKTGVDTEFGTELITNLSKSTVFVCGENLKEGDRIIYIN